MKNPKLKSSELILTDDGRIYHLNLKPSEIAETIITVGDPDRVEAISKHFDTIEVKMHHREFKTHTGTFKGKRLSVVSTGIGTDNIDIVINELDALVNIDFKTRTIKNKLTSLTLVRVGTSGAIQTDIDIDSLLISETAIGFDSLLHFYANTSFLNEDFSEAFIDHTNWNPNKSTPYVVDADPQLLKLFSGATSKDLDGTRVETFVKGCTATSIGFYGPQGRELRLPTEDSTLNKKFASFEYNGQRITNFEMETSGIYGMARLLGHRAISLNAILANRASGEFSKDPKRTVNKLIAKTLAILAK